MILRKGKRMAKQGSSIQFFLFILLVAIYQTTSFMMNHRSSSLSMTLKSQNVENVSRRKIIISSGALLGINALFHQKSFASEKKTDTTTPKDTSSQTLEEKYRVTSKCFMDLSIAGKPAGRIVISLFGEDVPETVKNFEDLCTGAPGFGYKGSNFYRVIEGFTLQAGAIGDNTGRSGKSSFGALFGPENFNIPHSEVGVISMARALDGKNDSRFFIQTQADAAWANGKYVAFGKVTEGLPLLEQIEKLKVKPPQNNPVNKVVIEDCGKI